MAMLIGLKSNNFGGFLLGLILIATGLGVFISVVLKAKSPK
jgi:hypothetical protein